jgi:hypothetical protein
MARLAPCRRGADPPLPPYRFAVSLNGVHTPASMPLMAARIDLVDPKTRVRRTLSLPGPSHLCGFSRDGSQLLLLTLERSSAGTKEDPDRGLKSDACILNLRRGTCRRIARDVFAAAWIEGSDETTSAAPS